MGSPRENANTAKLVQKALEAARSVSGIETELYQMAGKKFHHCTGCYNCLRTGAVSLKTISTILSENIWNLMVLSGGADISHVNHWSHEKRDR